MDKQSKSPLRLEWVQAKTLKENPANWRRHPESQLAALKDLIRDPEIGWAGALLWNSTTQRIIDGHGRLNIVDPEEYVPVLIGSWSEQKEKEILLSLDPLASLAIPDPVALRALLDSVELGTDALKALGVGLEEQLAATQLPLDADGKEYDESVKGEVEIVKCPQCGHEFPK